MKHSAFAPIIFILTLGLYSCGDAIDQSKRMAQKVKDKTTHEIEKQSKKLMGKVFPVFDHDQPDTENNKQRFKDFLKVDITEDVKNIYCYADDIGIDKDYSFAFNCNQATSDNIIAENQLSLDTDDTDFSSGLHHDFDWWDKERIANLPRYTWTDGDQYFKYYWYDAENEQAYFFDFDL